MSILKKIIRSKLFITCVALVAFYTLGGFFIAPWLVRHYVPKIVQEQLKKQAAIGEVRINPYIFTVEANDFRLEEPDGQSIAGFKRLFVDFELKSLFKWAWTFHQVALEEPLVNAVIAKDGALNLASLAPPSEEPTKPEEKDQAPPPMVIEEVSIDQGRIDFTDQRQSQPASISLKPLQLQIKNLTTLPKQEGPKSITANLGDGGVLKWTGEIGLNPIVTEGSFSIENVQIATAWEFFKDAVNLEKPTGKTSIAAQYSVNVAGEDPQVELANLSVKLTDIHLKLQDAKTPFLELPELLISDGRFDLAGRRLDIGKIDVKAGRAEIAVDEVGISNVQKIAKQVEEKPSFANQPLAGPDKEAQPWKITLGSLDIDGMAIGFQNLKPESVINSSISNLKLGLKAEAEAGDAMQLRVSDIAVGVSNLAAGASITTDSALKVDLELPELLINDGRFDLAGRQMDIGKIDVKAGRAEIAVNEAGTSNVRKIAKEAEPKPSIANQPSAGPDKDSQPWKIRLGGFDLDGMAIGFQNMTREPGIKASIGKLKVGLKAETEAGDAMRLRVRDIAVGATGLTAGFPDATDPVLQVDAVALKEGEYDLAANRLTANAISIVGGNINVQRQADNNINLALLLAPPQKGVIAEQVTEAAAEAAAKGRPFQFLFKAVSLSGLKTAYSDFAVQPGGQILNLEDITVALSDVNATAPMTFNASLKVREGGQIKAGGTVDPSGPTVESDVQVTELGLTAFQPYIGQVATIDLKSGSFSTQGKMRHGIKAAGAQTAYQGGFKLDNLRITESGGKETLVGWKSVQTDQMGIQLEPNRIEIGDLKVMQPTGKFIIEKDRSINVAKVVKADPDAKKSEASPKAPRAAGDDPFPYRVRRVLVSDGKVDFADLSLITPFGTKIHELKGVVAGVSSVKNARAQIKLDGRVDDYGTAKVDGELNTSDPKAFTNISVVFRNVEMSRLTPYSGKFAGRKIDSGKLSVDLKYRIDKSQLAGDNKLVVERLTLGEKVQSPEAVDLPLDLAIALLEDTSGVIDLGLPVSGNLDSPEFSYGALIGKALSNLLTKIVTSPFRALGALLPGGGDEDAFKSVAFAAGRPDVPPPEKEKLATLAGALQKRPQLKLSVQGRYNSVTDRAELQSEAMRRTLAIRLGQKPDPAEDPGPVDFSSPETGKALEAMFSERFGADTLKTLKAEQRAVLEKARKEAADVKASGSPPPSVAEDPGELSKTIFTRLTEVQPVDEPMLAKLADSRAQAIVAELTNAGQIPAERIEVKPSAADDKKDPVTASLSLESGK
jgi:hypothetical protein